MTFLSPIWLLGLLPWAAVALYLLSGRRRQERVPFVGLWVGPVTGPRPKRRLAKPPAAVALCVVAMLLALLAAARPRVDGVFGARRGPGVTVVVDRGASMSARGPGETRFVEAAAAVTEELRKHRASTPLEVHAVPARPVLHTGAGDWLPMVREIPRTAVDTTDELNAKVAELRRSRGLLVVLSDRQLSPADDGVVEVAPDGVAPNAAIVSLALSESPKPQAMVRVVSDLPTTPARVEVTAAGQTSAADVALPAAGAAPVDVFVDLPAPGDVVSARLVVDDAFEGDNVAWLVRTGSWPRVEPRAALGPELARMVEVYRKSRPAGDASPRVVVVDNLNDVPPATPAVVVAPADIDAGDGSPEVAAHPVTRSVGDGFRLPGARSSGTPPPAQHWTPLVRLNGKVAVAVREQPARQVWVGLDSPQWARRPEYVVFWTNVFDWLGGSGGPEWRSAPAGPLGAGWRRVDDVGGDRGAEPGLWPGLFERAEDGARRAVNAAGVPFPIPHHDPNWRQRLAQELARQPGATPVEPPLLVAALTCLALAGVAFGAKRSPAAVRRPAPTLERAGMS